MTLTPEQQAILNQQVAQETQAAQAAQQIQPQLYMQQPYMQQPYPQMAYPQQPPTLSPEEIAIAKQILGLDKHEESLKKTEEALNAMMEQAKQEKTMAAVQKKYPDVPPELIEAELKKLDETSPELAKLARTNETALEMVVKNIKADLKPKNKPDPITDSSSGGNGEAPDSLLEKIKRKEATPIELGMYLGTLISSK